MDELLQFRQPLENNFLGRRTQELPERRPNGGFAPSVADDSTKRVPPHLRARLCDAQTVAQDGDGPLVVSDSSMDRCGARRDRQVGRQREEQIPRGDQGLVFAEEDARGTYLLLPEPRFWSRDVEHCAGQQNRGDRSLGSRRRRYKGQPLGQRDRDRGVLLKLVSKRAQPAPAGSTVGAGMNEAPLGFVGRHLGPLLDELGCLRGMERKILDSAERPGAVREELNLEQGLPEADGESLRRVATAIPPWEVVEGQARVGLCRERRHRPRDERGRRGRAGTAR
jgi:hypothetical protein